MICDLRGLQEAEDSQRANYGDGLHKNQLEV